MLSNLWLYLLGSYEKDLIEKDILFPVLRWEEFYSTDSIDMVMIGSSHCYRTYIPDIIDRTLDIKSFNMCSSAQSPTTSYAVLNEIFKYKHPDIVVMDLYHIIFQADNQLKNARWNAENLKTVNSKLDFYSKSYSLRELGIFAVVPFFSHRGYLYGLFNKIRGRRYLPVEKGTYMRAGYVKTEEFVSQKELENPSYFTNSFFNENDIPSRHVKSLKAIIALCEKNNVELIFVTAPLPRHTFNQIQNYSDIHEYFNKYATVNELSYIDMNQHDIPLTDTSHYYDFNHLNHDGAVITSQHLANSLKQIR